MIFGWRPKPQEPRAGAPIPLYYDYETFDEPEDDDDTGTSVVFYGFRPKNTHVLHKAFAKPDEGKYSFMWPPQNAFSPEPDREEEPREWEGMRPDVEHSLLFDSMFESGNLDMVVKRGEYEYDLYMRVDTNTKGHHQWFYFSAENKSHVTR